MQILTETNKPFDLSDSLVHLLHLARQRAAEAFTEAMPDKDLTPRQFAVLYTIYNNPGINQHLLSDASGSDRSTISELIKRMQNRGFVIRERSVNDARQWILKLSDHGNDCVEQCIPAAQIADQILLRETPEAGIEPLLEALKSIAGTTTKASR